VRNFWSLAPILATVVAASASARDPVRIAQADAQQTESAAQEAQSATPSTQPSRPGIEEIVIRGGASEAASDFKTGDSVTGFSAADLEALGAESLEDLDTYTPNLEIVTSGATTPTFFIRGIGLNDFNANSTGAVAIYQDDVPINAPALQLGTLFDLEAVNVQRGPQGSGPNRNASAGAIKVYTRKPSGEFGGYLRSDFGNYEYRDFEGAIEAPTFADLFSTRLAFRLSQREGYQDNGCGDLPPLQGRPVRPPASLDINPLWSLCGESVRNRQASSVPAGLPEKVNDLGNWAARGQVLFEPTLDMSWLLNAHGGRRDAQSQLGQTIGVRGRVATVPGCTSPECLQNGILGGTDGGIGGGSFGYRDPDIWEMLGIVPGQIPPAGFDATQLAVANKLANNLDTGPWRGDYDRVGQTKNDTWGGFLRGDLALPGGINFTTITGYDSYDRLINVDLDQSPNVLFETITDDEGWQFTEDLRVDGQFAEGPVRWNAGGYYLMEKLDVQIENLLGGGGGAQGVSNRDYTQDLWSLGLYGGLEWDFWDDFTLDGGMRWNWETKSIDFSLIQANAFPVTQELQEGWNAPTGFIRLTYRFREDTHAYLKYTRGWKPGTYNATASPVKIVTLAEPEKNDSFEIGLRGSWLEDRLGLGLSLFYLGYDKYQIFTVQNDFGVPPEFVILNANTAEVYGSEIDLQARPWPGAFLNVRFSWLESQFLDFTQIQLIQRQVGLDFIVEALETNNTGNRLLNSPRFKVSLTAEQTLPLGRWGALIARYDVAWVDTNYFDATEGRGVPNLDGQIFLPENTLAQAPYWIHNARLGYRPPGLGLEISGWVRNFTNEAYKTFAFNASGAPFFTTIYYVGEPRTYGLSVTASF
jgi:iron complex outermembrane receptor protein